ncbi:thrombospondin type-1 domain-containing protein 4-like [Hyposmocoma kahamanoa]|uniref:thrombospondin type-1 domain-containing protein 4-like n=1 Tax=Hyposmocoma kahamanoa TaxID=1477025 RepID=UPI000E6DA361|nr:thrombospondin type-1 domain-containing protein 4-like [Hyposmocoma kahamanoa]XP_026320557.1 thrombospondin type-1 domain-containing protein 4-like [Hyposmocoma kahamanoa]XP_026320558.1 thrombospondin type-1 domain-containing protein 4-like [Hyposmocoma kahamanoa]XP_026320559.1 thrombospondin type-1 domain-containing protein 4-like [Hyposmocoma kahamanoa]XP_026320560.1 thrombospondin type-1 domain-containing protein 4-like [Hyposmocoma kahamanoa]XP_026320561.1 thrombospondin type-1 domain-c
MRSSFVFSLLLLVVGRESVLSSSSTRELHCGRRLVSGLFSRPRLPLGYSYVTTVPRGACRINVSEIVSSENYIALKILNGSYIMNGEFAVSVPGAYDAAGARFIYSRKDHLDSVFAVGPIHEPIDIMILYTRPNPNIRYEYFTESVPGEVDPPVGPATRPHIPDIVPTIQAKHTSRHHSFDYAMVGVPKHDMTSLSKESSLEDDNNMGDNVIGGRIFSWKIMSYTQCSRSCGGGFQVGKYRCVESDANGSNREVSPVHCNGSSPAARRRRCGNVPCAPRWRAAVWSTCPKCGPASKSRIVGCVQDHSRGISKVSDLKCLAPKPPTTDVCNIPDCNEVKYIASRQMIPTRDHTDRFRDGPVYTVPVNNTKLEYGPEYSFSPIAGWLYTDWSDCVGWCVGGGVQSRGVRCADPSGCAPRKSLETSKSCTPSLACEPHKGHWFTGDWSPCSSTCGGKQIRGVLCIGGTGRHLRDAACRSTKPETERDCGEECPPKWYFSDWGQCTGNCTTGNGIQRRTVWCAQKDVASEESECSGLKPPAQRTCPLKCSSVSIATLPPNIPTESQKSTTLETPNTPRTTVSTRNDESTDCEDKLTNCALAVQARLCHYNYYVQYCCHSCRGR